MSSIRFTTGPFTTSHSRPRYVVKVITFTYSQNFWTGSQPVPVHSQPLTPTVETHASLGAHIPISVHPSLFALLSTATRTQPARELSDAQLGTSDRVLRRSRMSGYSLPLPASVAITRISFGSVWTSSRYSAQPPAPNPHESSPMRSLVHPIGSREGPA